MLSVGYARIMNNLSETSSASWALAVRSACLLLVVTAGKEKEKITELITALTLRGSLYTIAAGEWLPGYGLARAIRRRTVMLAETLERGRLARPFTCYQLVDLLADAALDGDPILILDFLHTFYDSDISLAVRFRVLRECCQHLQRLSRTQPVAVIVRQEPVTDFQYFYPFLAQIADEILQPALEAQEISQHKLF